MCNSGTYQNQSVRGKVWVYIIYNQLRDRLVTEKESVVDRVQEQVKQQVAVTKVRKQDPVTAKKEDLGGQMPLQKRLPKIGFTSKVEKPYVINVEKIKAVAELDEITLESIASVHKLQKTVKRVKLIGASAKDLASKIKDDAVTTSGK